MAPKRKSKDQPGNFRSRQTAKLNSARTQKNPPVAQPRTGPRRQLPPSSEGGKRVGNSSQPFGERVGSGQQVRPVKVREIPKPQLPAAKTVPESRRLPGMQGPQPASRPAQPGTSRPQPVSRAAAAQAKAAEAAKGTSSTNVRTGQPAKIKGGGRLIGGGNAAILALQAANAVQDKLMTPEQLKVKRANEISRDNIQFPKFPSGQKKSQPPAPKPSVSSLTDKGGIFNVNKTGNVKVTPKKKEEPSKTSTSSQQPARQAPQERRPNPIPKASSSNTKPAQPTEKAYGESGKDLYMASKKNNPLMQRTFGYQTGDGPSSKTEAPSSKPIPKNGSATQDSKVTFTPEEQKKGSQAFNQDSVNRLGKRETAEEKRKRQAKGGMA